MRRDELDCVGTYNYLDASSLPERLENWRRDPRGCLLVLVTGCFDLCHIGHIYLLRKACEAGAARAGAYAAQMETVAPPVRVLVGINSDESVRCLKGPGRPIVPQLMRAAHLIALRYVSAVTVFEEDHPETLIWRVRPDLYVRGGDYANQDLPEQAVLQAVGAAVQFVPRAFDVSTSALIARMRGDTNE